MKVLAHLDPFALEAELLDRVAAAKEEDPLAPVLVVVPTARLARHVRLRVAERLGAALAVEVVHHRSLALAILERDGEPPPRIASRNLEEALLHRALSRLVANPLARYVREMPGALGAILATVRDLREAGVEAETLEREAREGEERALADVHREYSRAIEGRRAAGFTDDAGLAREAAGRAETFAARYRAILHHGAYELIGAHLELVRALDRGREVTFLLPADPGSAVSIYAERFASRFLLPEGGTLERIRRPGGGLLGERLRFLYDESSDLEPLSGAKVSFRHAQGARAEILVATRQALAAAAASTLPREIAIVARSLAPFAAGMDEVLDHGPLPFTTSLASPLRREPRVRDLLLLLGAVADSFPRASTAEILASPRVRWEALGLDAAPPGDLAERWSRRAGITGGAEPWTIDLVEWAGRTEVREDASDEDLEAARARAAVRAAEARRIADAVRALASACGPARARGWRAHADSVEDLARRAIGLPGEGKRDPALEALAGLLAEMRALPAFLGEDREVPFPEMVAWIEQAADGASREAEAPDCGGLRALDAMQSRGMTFDRVFLIGMNSGAFPRVPREDPFLRDDVRERLRRAAKKPLPVKREGADEERLLLALVLGMARDRLDVSWQRADETGRAKASSIALREIARLSIGTPDLNAVRRAAAAVPSHPEQRLEALEKDPGLLSPEEGSLLLALRGASSPETAARLAALDPELAGGLEMLLATETFAPVVSQWDARIGSGAWRSGRFTATSLERLGSCPLQFFFRHVLRVFELEEAPSDLEIPASEMGGRVHALLESLLRRLGDEGLFARGSEDAPLRRAAEILGEEWDRAFAGFGERSGRRLPVLWDVLSRRWRKAILEFLRDDLSRMAARGVAPRDLERTVRARLDFGSGVEIEIEGRLDRVLAGGESVIVSDYKTSGNLEDRVDPKRALRGWDLQAPLYSRLASGAPVEFVGVGPAFDPGPGIEERPRLAVFEGFPSAGAAAGFDETIRVLVLLATEGRFPLRAGRHCAWCPYDRACRRTHPPTVFREEHARDTADFRDLAAKNRKGLFTLADVRAAGARAEGEE